MDAGGLAQMTFNSFHQNTAPSFGSRGKASHLRNISVPASNNLAAPSHDNQSVPTPRSARSALLAGLRTQPKPNNAPTQQQNGNGHQQNQYSASNSHYTGFTQQDVSHQPQQRLPTPPSMASPAIRVSDGENDGYEMDQYAQMMAQNMYLNHVQQQLAAAQKVQQLQAQLAQLQMQSGMGYSATPPMSPGMGGLNNGLNLYNQAMSNYYNPYQQQQAQQQQYSQLQQYSQQQLTQQQQQALNYAQQQQLQQQQQQQQMAHVEISPPTPQLEQPPSAGLSAHRQNSRSRSPPKLNLQNSNSANAATFRRGHRKASSLSTCTTINNLDIADAPKTSVPRMSGLPGTPMTATFGPGHASGTHPTRQPRGPPSIEELKAKPTAKVEGSQNFATRQRRRAVSKLISAGIERRSARSTSGSAPGTMTPVSENEGFAFEDTESVGSNGTGRQSRQSLRDTEYNNSSADESSSSSRVSMRPSGLRAPSLVVSAAEKRKSALF